MVSGMFAFGMLYNFYPPGCSNQELGSPGLQSGALSSSESKLDCMHSDSGRFQTFRKSPVRSGRKGSVSPAHRTQRHETSITWC